MQGDQVALHWVKFQQDPALRACGVPLTATLSLWVTCQPYGQIPVNSRVVELPDAFYDIHESASNVLLPDFARDFLQAQVSEDEWGLSNPTPVRIQNALAVLVPNLDRRLEILNAGDPFQILNELWL